MTSTWSKCAAPTAASSASPSSVADSTTAPSMAGAGAEVGEKLCSAEAEAAVRETGFGVRDIRVAEALPFSSSLAYLNLTTLEGQRLCVQISAAGFRPVGLFYDDVVGPVPPPKNDEDEDEDASTTTRSTTRGAEEGEAVEVYETIYALLSARSRGFRQRFSERLAQRLAELQAEQEQLLRNHHSPTDPTAAPTATDNNFHQP